VPSVRRHAFKKLACQNAIYASCEWWSEPRHGLVSLASLTGRVSRTLGSLCLILPQAPGGLCTSPNQRVTLLLLQETVPKKFRLFREAENFKARVQFLVRNTLKCGIREGFGLNADSQGFLGIPGRLARNPHASFIGGCDLVEL